MVGEFGCNINTSFVTGLGSIYDFKLLSFTVLPDPELDFLNYDNIDLPLFRRENEADDVERSSDQLTK